MFMDQRRQKILEMIEEEKTVYVNELSKLFDVSEVVIRRDLTFLEQTGKIKRTYGGAILKRDVAKVTSFNTRVIHNLDTKEAIAQKAYEHIEDGDRVFLDISSTTYLLAKEIAQNTKKVTVVTNMVEIAAMFTQECPSELICIGGIFNKSLGGIVGSAANEAIACYKVDKAFIGSCGVNIEENTISNFDLEEGMTKKAIINAAKQAYILMDNSKFNVDGLYQFATLDDIHSIITEKTPTKKIVEHLQEQGIYIY